MSCVFFLGPRKSNPNPQLDKEEQEIGTDLKCISISCHVSVITIHGNILRECRWGKYGRKVPFFQSFVPYSPLWKNMYNNLVPSCDENDSSQQPKNVPYVLWRNINTAEQFKTGGVTDKKDNNRQLIHSSTRCTATLYPDLSRGGWGVSVHRQVLTGSTWYTKQYWNHTRVGLKKQVCTKQKNFD